MDRRLRNKARGIIEHISRGMAARLEQPPYPYSPNHFGYMVQWPEASGLTPQEIQEVVNYLLNHFRQQANTKGVQWTPLASGGYAFFLPYTSPYPVDERVLREFMSTLKKAKAEMNQLLARLPQYRDDHYGYLVRVDFSVNYLREHVLGAMYWLAEQYNRDPNTWGMLVIDLNPFYDTGHELALYKPVEVED